MKTNYILVIIIIAISFSCNNISQKEEIYTATELRIISLVPSITNEIIELGLKDNIVGATSYCEITKANKELIVGSVIEINEEKILLLKPDIVFASTLVKEKSIKTLTNNGIKVEYLDKIESFNDMCEFFLKLGDKLDKDKLAEKYVNKAKNSIDSLKNIIPKTKNQNSVFFQLGANPLATVIPYTYMNDFITFANCQNIFYDLDNIMVNRESVLLRNPDYIIITSMGGVGEQEKEVWRTYTNVTAVKNNNIFIVESASTPTIKNFITNFDHIINEIYFKETSHKID